MYRESIEFETLLGKTLTSIENNVYELVIKTSEGETYTMIHEQSCCELVRIEDITGDLEHLIGSPILKAEVSNNIKEETSDHYGQDEWTFYKLATVKGYVDIRWFGTSNGYYSTSVDFYKITSEEGDE